MPTPLTIGVDFNHTYEADPEAFREMVLNFQKRGHICVLVTSRHDGTPEAEEVRKAIGTLMPVVFAGDVWKAEAAEAAGYKVDIWCDDKPTGVEHHRPHSKHHWVYDKTGGWTLR